MKITSRTCYFNQCFNLYTYIKEWGSVKDWNKVSNNVIRINDGHGSEGDLRLTQYEFEGITFYTFGLMLDDPKQRPGHGGEWSSNQTTIQHYFGIELIGAGLDSMAVSMTYDQAFKLFNPDIYKKMTSEFKLGFDAPSIKEPKYMRWYDHNGILLPVHDPIQIYQT